MKLKKSEIVAPCEGQPPIYEIESLDEEELLGRAIVELRREGKDFMLVQTPGRQTSDAEIEKLGLSYEMLSDSWGVPEDAIRYLSETGKYPAHYQMDDIFGEIGLPLLYLTIHAVEYAWDQEMFARKIIFDLTTAEMRKLDKPQLTMATVAKYAGVEEERLERFSKGEDCLTSEEVSRICISLLIVDRTLNYRSRRDYFFTPDTSE